jgi:peptidoglycan DL-endopeptidase CwlO
VHRAGHRVGPSAVVLSLILGLGGVAAASAAPSGSGHHVYPSKQQVQDAQDKAVRAAHDVAGIKAALAQADLRMQASAVTAEKAAERYNGARWKLQQAQRDARVAARHASIAAHDVAKQHASYAATVVSSYEMGPSLSPLSAVQGSGGLPDVVSKLATLQNAQAAMDHTYDSYRATSTLAGVASDQADAAQAKAEKLAAQAREARDRAAAAEAAAQQAAQSISAEKTQLIQKLAKLKHESVALAQQRQAGIEKAAEEAARRAAERAAREKARAEARERARERAQQQAQQQAQQSSSSTSSSSTSSTPTSDPTPEPPGPPSPPPTPPTPPAPASGASAAIAFARAQIGEPYVWGAAGPSSWDCSGLTMGAWRAGGISLPHYSVAQYAQSTPISPSALRPGDLVFWGSSSSPSSIYHVALYVGNGMIIQAPHTGADVDEVSMYSWVAPNFYARP